MTNETNNKSSWWVWLGAVSLVLVIIGLIVPLLDNPSMLKPDKKSSIRIGDYIQFGKYDNQPILWRVIHQDGDRDPVLFSDKIIALKAFDAAGSYHVESDRKKNGSNNYENSNIRQWLNSSAQSIDWIQNSPSAANMWEGNNPYDKEKGFLANGNFSESERNMMKPLSHRVILADIDKSQADGGSQLHQLAWKRPDGALTNHDQAYYKTLEDVVFLLSVKQLKEWVYDQRATLGDEYHIGRPTAQAVTNNTFKTKGLSKGDVWFYWLNSSDAKNSYSVRGVNVGGALLSFSASVGNTGVRPALQLDLTSAKFASKGDGSSEKPYVVKGE